MNTSTNEAENTQKTTGGAFADALTFLRAALTIVIAGVIIGFGWPNNLDAALLASFLFIIAALTDLFDDLTGGHEKSRFRKLGWFDDMADTVLIIGTLAAMAWVIHQAGYLNWIFLAPIVIIVAREVIVGAIKGRDFRTEGWPETRIRTFKTAIMMLAVCTLVASPWLTSWIDGLRASEESVLSVYDASSPYVWWAGLGLLWISAVLSVLSGFQLLFGSVDAEQDS